MISKKSRKQCIVLFSGGLDSRLAIKIMQKQDFQIIAVYFKLPFSCSCFNDVEEFSKEQKIKLKVFDCTKGKLFREYFKTIKNAKYGRGSGINPCIDCKIFMFKKAKEFAKKLRINLIVSGEVSGQRPMSQNPKQIEIIEKESGLKGKVYRPLIKLGINGRQRKKQIELAKKFKIKYPNPAGGCLLCEKLFRKRFKFILKRGLSEKEFHLMNIGRHFVIDNCWVILGRNESENKIIENLKTNSGRIIASEDLGIIGPTAIILDKCKKTTENKIKDLIKAYSKNSLLKEKNEFKGNHLM